MKSLKRILLSSIMLALLCSSVWAGTFTVNGGRGTSTVGTGGDYASLAAAAADFNTYTGGCSGDWTLEILNNLTETANVGFGNLTNGYTVTIKPAAGQSPTITFSATAVNGTYPGHLVFGAKNFAATPALNAISNVVLDGSNNGTTSQDLTIQNNAAAIANSRVILIYGNCDNITVKNCVIKNLSISAAANSSVGVEVMSQASINIPENCVIQNNVIQAAASAASYGTGIQATNTGTITIGNAQTGYVFTQNTITARYIGILLNQSADGTVSYNTISIQNAINNVIAYGIRHAACNSTQGWTINIYGNKLIQLQTANATANMGIIGIDASGAWGTGQLRPTYNIHNNMITGFDYGTGTVVDQIYKGIQCGSETTIYNVCHNSINMVNQARISCATDGRVYGIGFVSTSFGSVFANVKNNMIRLIQTGSAANYRCYGIYRLYTLGVTNVFTAGLVSDYNDIYTNGTATQGSLFGYWGATRCLDVAAWRTASAQDAKSINTDPLTYWTSATDLHITSYPGDTFKCLAIDGITEDVDAETRNGSPLMGCDESGTSAAGPTINLPVASTAFGKKLSIGNGGVAVTKDFVVWNLSNTPMNITRVYKTAGSDEITTTSYTASIPANGAGKITLTYTPTTVASAISTTFQINSDGGNVTFTATGRGGSTKKFSEPPNVGAGTSTVGAGADDDYLTLSDAAFDFSNTSGGCTNNWTLLINSATLTEVNPILFGNATNGYAVTLKPNAGLTPIVTLNQSAMLAAKPGHMIIGINNLGDTYNAVKTDNFVIDGDNGGALSKDLTIQSYSGNLANSRVITVWGDCDNFILRNANITGRSTNAAANGNVGIDFISYYYTLNSVLYNLTPDNFLIENNTFTDNTSTYGCNIQASNSGTLSLGNSQSGYIIRNNTLVFRQRGIYLNQSAGGDIYNNTFSVTTALPGASGLIAHAIYHLNCNNTPGWTLNIYNNIITDFASANTSAAGGIVGIEASGAAVSGAMPTYNIYNNMIANYNFTANVTNPILRGIVCGTTNCYFNVYFNSLNFPDDAQTTLNASNVAFAIGTTTNLASALVTNIKNNIIRSTEPYMTALYKYETSGLTSNNNDFWLSGANSRIANYAGAVYTTLALWQAAFGQDMASQNVDPRTGGGAWPSEINLRFASYNGDKYIGTAIAGITTDIDGDARGALPYMGCDEKANSLTTGDIYTPASTAFFGKKLTIPNGGGSVDKDFDIWNIGTTGALNITTVTLSSGSADFSVLSAPTTIPANSKGTITFRYTPTTMGAVTAIFNIASDDVDEPNVSITTSGRGSDTKKFSEYPVGRLVSKIGPTADDDYLSLAEASADFTNTAGGSTGDWTLWITTNLTETSIPAFGNATNGYKVYIKPTSGAAKTVTLSATTMSSIPGHIIIGTNNPANLYSVIETDGFVIDGDNDGIASTRELTFVNTVASIANSRIFTIFGECDNIIIKNSIITNNSTSNAANGCVGIDMISRNNTPPNTNYIPDNCRVDNCVISCYNATSGYGIGIQATNSGTIISGNAQTGLNIVDNTITARLYGIYLNQNADANVLNNKIRIQNAINNVHAYGIAYLNANATTGWITNITGNIIDQLQTANTTANMGITGIEASGSGTTGNLCTINIIGNMVCGFQFTGASNVDQLYRGIVNNSAYTLVYINNNSINMPNFTQATGATAGRVMAIGSLNASFTGICELFNNIIRVERTTASGFYHAVYKANATNYFADYNNIFVTGSANAFVGRLASSDYTTLAAWQTATGQEANSTSLDPTVAQSAAPYDGVWTNAGTTPPNDLHFTTYTDKFYGMASGNIYSWKDCDKQYVHPAQPYKGCDDKTSLYFPVNYLDFGKKNVVSEGGSVEDKNIAIYNFRGTTVNISDVQLVSGDADFSIVSYPSSIAAGATDNVTVRFNPTTKGFLLATFKVVTDDALEPDTFIYCRASTTKKFSDAGGKGVASVGSDAYDDYTSLESAAADFNGYAGGCSGDYSLIISSNIIERNNIAFGNNVNGKSFTIKTNPYYKNVKVDLGSLIANTGYYGTIIIGSSSLTSQDVNFDMDNVTIDGGAVGSSTRDLIFTRLPITTNIYSRIIQVVGDCDYFTIRNCKLMQLSSYAGYGNAVGIEFLARNTSTNQDLNPDNGRVDNCYISAIRSPHGVAIQQNNSGGLSNGVAESDYVIDGCYLEAAKWGIFLNHTAGITISNNTINLIQNTNGYLSEGIYHLTSNGKSGWTTNIFNNTFANMTTINSNAAFGIMAIDLSAPIGILPSTYNIYNNSIGGFNLTYSGANTANNIIYRGIYCTTDLANYNIYNNSIYMPNFPKFTGSTDTYVNGISMSAFNHVGNINIKNNLVHLAHVGGSTVYIYSGTSNLSVDYNNWYAGAGVALGRYIGTNYSNLAGWRAASGFDANSTAADPSSLWVSAGDLHFSGVPGNEFTGKVITEVPQDIDKAFRSTVAPYKGCDDPPVSTLTVSTPYGVAFPTAGNHYITLAKNLTAYMTNPFVQISSDIAYRCSGWTGTGSIPVTGTGTNVTAMFSLPSTISWLWTQQYHLEANSSPSAAGAITLDDYFTPATGWFDSGTSFTVVASAALPTGSEFDHWSGDLTGSTNPTTISMNAPNKNIVAHFKTCDINLLDNLLEFGVRTSPTDRQLIIQNLGDYPLTIYSISLSTGDPNFTILTPLPFTIPAANSDVINVRFTPLEPRPVAATFTITSDDADEIQIPFYCSGDGSVPDINLTSPQGLTWANRLVGSGAQTDKKVLRINNVGLQNLAITNIEFSGTTDIAVEDFPATGTVILPNNFADVTLAFTPTTTGNVTKTITISTNDPDEPTVFASFIGQGTNVSNIPNPLDIGFAKTTGAGGTGVANNINIVNTSSFDTTYTIAIDLPVFTAAQSNIFVPAGTTQSLPITYRPIAVVDNTAQYTLTSSNPQCPNLTGSILGRGWTMTEGLKVTVDGAIGGTFKVGNSGTYTNTSVVIPAGAFEGSRELKVQEPSNYNGRPNAIEVIVDPAPATLPAAKRAIVDIEYQNTDLELDILSIHIPLLWNAESVTKWSGTDYSIIPSMVPGNISSGKYEVGALVDTFGIFATKNSKTDVADWSLLDK